MLNPEFIVLLQSLADWIILPMRAISFLGDAEFYIFVAPIVYWCIDSSLGFRLSIFLIISASLNLIFKLIVHSPRPFWVSQNVKPGTIEYTYGIPSGHAQNAVVIWGTIAAYYKNTWGWIFALIVIILIGISRLFLGVHFLADVLFGWIVGALLLFFLLKLEPGFSKWARNQQPILLLTLGFLASILIIGSGMLVQTIQHSWTIPEKWIQITNIISPWDEENNPLSIIDLISFAGVLFGLIAGKIAIDQNGGFSANGKLLQKFFRFLIGLLGVVLIWAGLRSLLPSGNDFIPLFFRYFRYWLVGFWMIGIAPWIFIKLKLAGKTNI